MFEKMVSMKVFLIFVTLNLSANTWAGQRAPFEANSLNSATYIIIGKVTAASFDQKKFRGIMEIAALSSLKGNFNSKSFKVNVDKNPMDGFDVLLNKNDVAVFFVRKIEDGMAQLIVPGASATFPKEYFK
jgi:hypothetical protein